jgi:hypothetical protein
VYRRQGSHIRHQVSSSAGRMATKTVGVVVEQNAGGQVAKSENDTQRRSERQLSCRMIRGIEESETP